MDQVAPDVDAEVAAHGARLGLQRVGGADNLAAGDHRLLALPHHRDHRAAAQDTETGSSPEALLDVSCCQSVSAQQVTCKSTQSSQKPFADLKLWAVQPQQSAPDDVLNQPRVEGLALQVYVVLLGQLSFNVLQLQCAQVVALRHTTDGDKLRALRSPLLPYVTVCSPCKHSCRAILYIAQRGWHKQLASSQICAQQKLHRAPPFAQNA